MAKLKEEISDFHEKNGKYPAKWDEIADLKDEVYTDPWGKPYVLVVSPENKEQPFQIISYGLDGNEGGAGWDADLRL